jgi:branched-chain amino acid transport system substrate-binding protein
MLSWPARATADEGGDDGRGAILAIRGHGGAEGEFNFDANGDGLHGYNVVRNDGGRIVFVRRFEFTA